MRKNKEGQWELTGWLMGYNFVAVVDGEDLVVRNVKATWFGGVGDPGDSTGTASGVKNVGDGLATPDGCSLPIRLPGFDPTISSPLPTIPWKTQVRVYNRQNHLQIEVPLIDVGPRQYAASGAAIDLTQRSFLRLGGVIKKGETEVTCKKCNKKIIIYSKFNKEHKCSCGKTSNETDWEIKILQHEAGHIYVDYRVLGGARFLSPEIRRQIGLS